MTVAQHHLSKIDWIARGANTTRSAAIDALIEEALKSDTLIEMVRTRIRKQ